MATIYMNRFAIDENDQFEIHVKDYRYPNFSGKGAIFNAAEEVFLKAQQGSGYLACNAQQGYYRLKIQNY